MTGRLQYAEHGGGGGGCGGGSLGLIAAWEPSGQGWGADPRGDTRVSRNSHPQPCHLADLAKQIIFFQKMAPGGGGEALPAAPGASWRQWSRW